MSFELSQGRIAKVLSQRPFSQDSKRTFAKDLSQRPFSKKAKVLSQRTFAQRIFAILSYTPFPRRTTHQLYKFSKVSGIVILHNKFGDEVTGEKLEIFTQHIFFEESAERSGHLIPVPYQIVYGTGKNSLLNFTLSTI